MSHIAPPVQVLRGHKAILQREDLLKNFAQRCGQNGAMHWLSYFLSGRGATWKRPSVVLILKKQVSLKDLQVEDLLGAVLLYELRLFGVGTGAFATDDWEATRTVIAAREMRAQIVAHTLRFLVEHGAQVALITYDGPPMPVRETSTIIHHKDVLWAEHSRTISKGLPLSPTFDELLARFGKQTRFNLRYYRRRLSKRVEVEFLHDAAKVISCEELIALNERSLNPVTKAECERRFRALQDPDSFLAGIREKNGDWLSFLGGWRQAGTTVMHFQVNASARREDSIGTVMRSYFMEDEIARGAKRLLIYHGTRHKIASSFETAHIRDVVVRRKSFQSRLLQKLAKRLNAPEYEDDPELYRGSTSFLASVLTSAGSVWNETFS